MRKTASSEMLSLEIIFYRSCNKQKVWTEHSKSICKRHSRVDNLHGLTVWTLWRTDLHKLGRNSVHRLIHTNPFHQHPHLWLSFLSDSEFLLLCVSLNFFSFGCQFPVHNCILTHGTMTPSIMWQRFPVVLFNIAWNVGQMYYKVDIR